MNSQTFKRKVQVWICCQNKVGLPLFLLLRTNPGRGEFWQPVTGGVEENEDLADAALREAVEETGLNFKSVPVSLESHFEFEARGKQIRESGFFLSIEGLQAPPKVQMDPSEHQDYRWVTASEALPLLKHQSNVQMLELLLQRLA